MIRRMYSHLTIFFVFFFFFFLGQWNKVCYKELSFLFPNFLLSFCFLCYVEVSNFNVFCLESLTWRVYTQTLLSPSRRKKKCEPMLMLRKCLKLCSWRTIDCCFHYIKLSEVESLIKSFVKSIWYTYAWSININTLCTELFGEYIYDIKSEDKQKRNHQYIWQKKFKKADR